MLPLFVFVTAYTSGERVCVNIMHIILMKETTREHAGCIIHLEDGSKLMARESIEDICAAIAKPATVEMQINAELDELEEE